MIESSPSFLFRGIFDGVAGLDMWITVHIDESLVYNRLYHGKCSFVQTASSRHDLK